MHQERRAQVESQACFPSGSPGVVQGDDNLALDEYELALVAFRQQTSHFEPVGAPFQVQDVTERCFGQLVMVDGTPVIVVHERSSLRGRPVSLCLHVGRKMVHRLL